MRLKIDLFTWVVIAIVLALVVAAVITVNVTGGAAGVQTVQVDAASPAAPIVAAILAMQKGDAATARTYFTSEILEQYEKQGYDPIANSANFALNGEQARRIRIVTVSEAQTDSSGDEIAFVAISEDNFSGGGLFGQSTWSSQRNLRVRRVDGEWKIDDTNFIY